MAQATVLTDRNSIDRPVVETLNPAGLGPYVLACEHASNFFPPQFDGLGLSDEVRQSHVAWDPGALAVAQLLAHHLDAPLVASRISRLIYDCNRPPMDDSATPRRSEIFDIPGNAALTDAAKHDRARTYYTPFRDALANATAAAEQRTETPVLITIHSFTPVYFGKHRDVEIGILHDTDSRFADVLLDAMAGDAPHFRIARNEPYGPADGVTHTLRDQALPRGLLNVMIEIRNDLIATPGEQAEMASLLARRFSDALTRIDPQTMTNNGNRPKGISHA